MKTSHPHTEAAKRIEKLKGSFSLAVRESKLRWRRYELLNARALPKPHLLKKEGELSKVNVQQVSVEQKEKESNGCTWSQAALHAHLCCVSQKHPGFVFLDHILTRPPALCPKRVHFWKLKNQALLSKKLQEKGEGGGDQKKRSITHMQEESPEDSDGDQNEHWQKMIHAKEERLFRVGSVEKG